MSGNLYQTQWVTAYQRAPNGNMLTAHFDKASSFGDDVEFLRDYAVYDTSRAEPCGNVRPNGFGLFDMAGNVAEWCTDAEGLDRVYRGGCWVFDAVQCRSACRGGIRPSRRSDVLGFRVALVFRFANGADKSLNNDNLADSTDRGVIRNLRQHRLFPSGGPSERDINQGLGDCWMLAGRGAAARANPIDHNVDCVVAIC